MPESKTKESKRSESKESKETKQSSPRHGKGLNALKKSMSPKRGKRNTLIRRLTHKLLVGRGKHCFKDWFSADEIDLFHDNPDITQLDPLFDRYKSRMENALEDFAESEGLKGTNEIMDAIQNDSESDRAEHAKLMQMIDTMSKKEDFFIMMQKRKKSTKMMRAGMYL